MASEIVLQGELSLKIRNMNMKSEGAITVFLSLVLLLILSLVMAILESARVNTAKIFAERALTTAMDSVLAEFYDPLMEEYHLLALEAGYGSGMMKTEVMEDKLKEYMSYTVTPNIELSYPTKGLELYDISLSSLSVTETAGLMDYQGQLFLTEAVDYMKYRELGDGMELLLNKMSMLKQPEKVSILYEEKLKVEEELVVIDEGILRLMMLFDGISTTKKGLKVNKEGMLQTVPDYIKKLCYGEITKEKTGIHNDSIFAHVKELYYDPGVLFSAIDEGFQRLDEILERIQILEAGIVNTIRSIEGAEITLKVLEARLASVEKGTEAYKEAQAQVKACKEHINDLQSQLNQKEMERTTCESQKLLIIEELNLHRSESLLLIQSIEALIPQAEAVIDEIIQTSGKADELIRNYEGSLKEAQEELGEGIFGTMEEGLLDLKRYQSGNIFGYDFDRMKQILKQDIEILTTVDAHLVEGGTALDRRDLSTARECFSSADKALRSYRTDGLTLDYSSLTIQKESAMDPLGVIGELVREGLSGLVVDSSELSDLELTKDLLPSDIASLSGEEVSGFDFGSLFKSLVIGGKKSGLEGLFSDFGEYDFASMLGEAANKAAEHLLFQAYLQEHFCHFPMEGEDISGRKPSALAYEQEYFLMGKASDKENLNAILTQVILIRTILNFTSILGDKAKWSEAKALAVGLVGFTGLPILVSITQTVLVVLLAFAEALVDTCALTLGKEVPIFKKRIGLTFYELLSLQREFIHTKAAGYPEETGTFTLSYGDYLKIFLFLKKKTELSYRCLDLIQENMKLRYEDSFSIQNCIFGFSVDAEFNINTKFISLNFVKKLLAKDIRGFTYRIEAGYSY